jgi:hypothetical protein
LFIDLVFSRVLLIVKFACHSEDLLVYPSSFFFYHGPQKTECVHAADSLKEKELLLTESTDQVRLDDVEGPAAVLSQAHWDRFTPSLSDTELQHLYCCPESEAGPSTQGEVFIRDARNDRFAKRQAIPMVSCGAAEGVTIYSGNQSLMSSNVRKATSGRKSTDFHS